jgi:hypothetical protein
MGRRGLRIYLCRRAGDCVRMGLDVCGSVVSGGCEAAPAGERGSGRSDGINQRQVRRDQINYRRAAWDASQDMSGLCSSSL